MPGVRVSPLRIFVFNNAILQSVTKNLFRSFFSRRRADGLQNIKEPITLADLSGVIGSASKRLAL